MSLWSYKKVLNLNWKLKGGWNSGILRILFALLLDQLSSVQYLDGVNAL